MSGWSLLTTVLLFLFFSRNESSTIVPANGNTTTNEVITGNNVYMPSTEHTKTNQIITGENSSPTKYLPTDTSQVPVVTTNEAKKTTNVPTSFITKVQASTTEIQAGTSSQLPSVTPAVHVPSNGNQQGTNGTVPNGGKTSTNNTSFLGTTTKDCINSLSSLMSSLQNGTGNNQALGGAMKTIIEGFLDQTLKTINLPSTITVGVKKSILSFLETNGGRLDIQKLTQAFQICSSLFQTQGQNPLILLREIMNTLSPMLNMTNIFPNQNTNMGAISDILQVLGNPQSAISGMVAQAVSGDVSEGCSASLTHVVTALTRHDLTKDFWALQMLDAVGKPEPGLLSGNAFWFGDYDECLRIEVPEQLQMETQFCRVQIAIPALTSINVMDPGKPPSVNLGVCFPKNCTSTDIQNITSTYLNRIQLYPWTTDCHKELELDTNAIIVISVVGFIAVLVVFATLFDAFIRWDKKRHQLSHLENRNPPIDNIYDNDTLKEKSNGAAYSSDDDKGISNGYAESSINNYKLMSDNVKPKDQIEKRGVCLNVLNSFSALTNLEKMFNTSQGSGALGAVNGIRFFSMSWVILGHSFVFIMFFPARNLVEFLPKYLQRWTFMVITNGLLSVDTFFLLSGLLVSYLFLKEITKSKGKINWFLFYFHRFWRLTPPYMMMLFVNTYLFKYVVTGPSAFPTEDPCVKYWWRNLAYINNVFPSSEMCFGWSWYLSNDMQFYVISPLILLPMYFSNRVKHLGSFVTAAFLLAATITPTVISAVYKLPETMYSVKPPPGTSDYFDNYYLRPYCRMGPYIVGLYLGYILFQNKCKAKMNKYKALFFWCASIATSCAIIYGTLEASKGNHPSIGVAAIYNGFSRTLWAMCVAWVIYACVTGNGGYVNSFLSWKAFVPLGRLTYCAYLVHPILMFVYLNSLRQPFDARDLTVIYYFFGNMVAAYLLACLISLLFEGPMIGLEKALLRKKH